MATAADIIKGALRRIQIVGSESPIQDDEIVDGLEDLNDWAIMLEASTLQLGFSPVSQPGNTISIPAQCVGMYKDNLAIYMAGQYGAPIAQTLAISARESMNQALIAFAPVIDVEFPDTLPIGSGNQCDLITRDQRFFKPNSTENF